MNQNVFHIKNPKVRPADQMLKAGHYNETNHVVSEGIKKKKFPVDNQVVGEYEIVIIDVDWNTSSQDVLSIASNLRFRRPVYADALLLGEQYPNEQQKGPIVFLHDPQYFWGGHFFSLVLKADQNRRIISLVSSSGWWSSSYRFAFGRRQK